MEEKENDNWKDKKHLEELKLMMRECADDIVGVMKTYMDMDDKYARLLTIWSIGCKFHKEFETYPELYINAMRGSGKTRLMKLLATLTDGILLMSITEAVLFRIPKHTPVFIDEIESIGSKEKTALRELLNASYKRGLKVLRMKKVRTQTGDDYIMDGFEPFKPIAMANIWGMDEVVGDRSVRIILEKSANTRYSMILEDFEKNKLIQDIKVRLNSLVMQLCNEVMSGGLIERWNNYIFLHESASSTIITFNAKTALTALQEKDYCEPDLDTEMLFETIKKRGIFGRNLELFFPLFQVASLVGDDWVATMLDIAEGIVHERKVEEQTQSKDVMLYEFISSKFMYDTEFIQVKELTRQFREYIGEDEDEERWLNDRWLGRALVRLNLIIEKKKVPKGILVRVNWKKAQEKLSIFTTDKGDVK